MGITLADQWLPWGFGLIVVFPLLMVGLGELILQLERRQHPMMKPVREVRNWVIPFAGIFFLLTRVLEQEKGLWPIQIIETFAWVALIVAALSFVNALLFTGAKTGSWQAEMPKLFRDLVRSLLIAIGIAIVLSAVFGVISKVPLLRWVSAVWFWALRCKIPLATSFRELLYCLSGPFKLVTGWR